ncbi:rap1 GTPase-GDP dissociation stimulator 1 [Salminus brasiliensis]|uniref:rap1 GTPase-GDP dissociation stimulator 1 n=1 Tax=Salminus brasiliensis TaxID=930266 RepID=UPI003B82DFF8
MDRRTADHPLPCTAKADSFGAALDAISVTTELVDEELKPHLDTLLTVAVEKKRGLAEQVVESGILPVLAQALRRKSSLTVHTARLLAELAREAPVRDSCFETGIISALLTLLLSKDEDLLLHVSRAIGRICYDSNLQQERLLRLGAVPRLVAVLLQHLENNTLLSSCLLALCNLADMGEQDDSKFVWEKSGHFDAGEQVFHGTSQHSFGFVSAVTVVRLNQWSPGQYSVSVEALQRCSTLLWGARNGRQTGWRLPHLGCCPKFYKVIKYSVKNIPKNRSLKAAVFHTFL